MLKCMIPTAPRAVHIYCCTMALLCVFLLFFLFEGVNLLVTGKKRILGARQSGGALVPAPPRATCSTPESIRIFLL